MAEKRTVRGREVITLWARREAPAGPPPKRLGQLFTDEEQAFIEENYRRLEIQELTVAFNVLFRARTMKQLRSFIKRRGHTCGRTGQFQPQQTPWNQGKTGHMGANTTSFKPGNLPHTKRRLWSERLTKDGHIEISIPERNPYTGAPTRFRHKHVWLWELEHGPVPKGMVVAFRDGDRLNFQIDNLILLSRAELLYLNRHGYRDSPDELKPSMLIMARLKVAESKAKKRLTEV